MKITALLSLAVIAFAPLLSAKEAPSPFADNSTALSAVRSYESAAIKADQDRAKVLLGLNERLVSELTRAKSSALKSEKLGEAVAIDKRIKEANEATVALRNVLKATKPEGVTPTATVAITGASTSVGTAKLVSDFVASSNKLSDVQKKVLSDLLNDKVAFTFDTGTPFAFGANGDLVEWKNGTPVRIEGVTFEDGVIKYANGLGAIDLSTITESSVAYTWRGKPYISKIIPASERDAVNKTTHRSRSVTPSDPDNTVFGRRVK